ncbi:unnamed protein product [Caretta caretta]
MTPFSKRIARIINVDDMTGRKKLSSSQLKKSYPKERENGMIAKMRKIDSFVVSVSADSETEKIVESSSEVKSENIGVDIENIDLIKVHIETNEFRLQLVLKKMLQILAYQRLLGIMLIWISLTIRQRFENQVNQKFNLTLKYLS